MRENTLIVPQRVTNKKIWIFKGGRDHIRKGSMEEVAFEKGLEKLIGFQLAEMEQSKNNREQEISCRKMGISREW